MYTIHCIGTTIELRLIDIISGVVLWKNSLRFFSKRAIFKIFFTVNR